MARRYELQALLETIVPNVYFQPPENVQMVYPCIVYHRDYADTKFANNGTYHHTKRYQLTVIDRDPDSLIPDKISELPMCRFERYFSADNLHHDIYNLYF